MADNYLEKQYEAYQARKAAWEKERKYGKKPSPMNHCLWHIEGNTYVISPPSPYPYHT